MKKIDTTNIAGLAKAPFIKPTHDHIKESIQDSTGNIIKGLLGSYTTNDLIILYGCVVAVTSGAIPGTGTATLSAGAIYYNGEIYEVDANASLSTTNPQTLIWSVVTTYIASDSTLTWSDGTIRNLHRIDKFQLTAGTAGSGLANYDGATVKYLDQFIPKTSGAIKLVTKRVLLGDWNMDVNDTKTVAHGLSDHKKIRLIDVIIRDDADAVYSPLSATNGILLDGLVAGGVAEVDSTIVYLNRATGRKFDAATYDSTGYNRGWVYITYEA